MKQKIILLGGFGGTGKTTVAALLHDALASNALIEADDLFHIKPFVIGEQMGRIKLKNTLDVMRNFLDEMYPYVICVGLVWSQEELDAVTGAFPGTTYEHFLFWFQATKEVRFQRVLDRSEPGDTLNWLEHVEGTIKNPCPFKMSVGRAVEIDTTHKLPVDIAQEILKLVVSDKPGGIDARNYLDDKAVN